MNTVSVQPPYRPEFYSRLLSIRPAQLGALAKQMLRIQRLHWKTLGGHTFWIDPVSVFGLALMQQGIYESSMTHLLQCLLRPGDTFIDVGGNEGYFSILAASLVQQGRVHCFEPQSRLQPILARNIELNSAHCVSVHPIALSDAEGEATIFLRPSTNNGASSFFRYWKLGSRSETISMTTLDKFCQQHPQNHVRLMKVDCEGAEYLVASGGEATLRQGKIDFIALEYHPQICGVERCREVHHLLKSSGYLLTRVNGQCIYHLPGMEQDLWPLGNLNINCEWQ